MARFFGGRSNIPDRPHGARTMVKGRISPARPQTYPRFRNNFHTSLQRNDRRRKLFLYPAAGISLAGEKLGWLKPPAQTGRLQLPGFVAFRDVTSRRIVREPQSRRLDDLTKAKRLPPGLRHSGNLFPGDQVSVFQAQRSRHAGPTEKSRFKRPCAFGPGPFPWPGASAARHRRARPWDSLQAGPIFRDTLPATGCSGF